jgi:hypothetical protein
VLKDGKLAFVFHEQAMPTPEVLELVIHADDKAPDKDASDAPEPALVD